MPKKTANGVNKSEFVRDFPLDVPAAEVVEKGKEKGIELTTSLVYSVRAATKKRNGSAQPGRTKPVKRRRSNHTEEESTSIDGLDGLTGLKSALNEMVDKRVDQRIKEIFDRGLAQ